MIRKVKFSARPVLDSFPVDVFQVNMTQIIAQLLDKIDRLPDGIKERAEMEARLEVARRARAGRSKAWEGTVLYSCFVEPKNDMGKRLTPVVENSSLEGSYEAPGDEKVVDCDGNMVPMQVEAHIFQRKSTNGQSANQHSYLERDVTVGEKGEFMAAQAVVEETHQHKHVFYHAFQRIDEVVQNDGNALSLLREIVAADDGGEIAKHEISLRKQLRRVAPFFESGEHIRMLKQLLSSELSDEEREQRQAELEAAELTQAFLDGMKADVAVLCEDGEELIQREDRIQAVSMLVAIRLKLQDYVYLVRSYPVSLYPITEEQFRDDLAAGKVFRHVFRSGRDPKDRDEVNWTQHNLLQGRGQATLAIEPCSEELCEQILTVLDQQTVAGSVEAAEAVEVDSKAELSLVTASDEE